MPYAPTKMEATGIQYNTIPMLQQKWKQQEYNTIQSVYITLYREYIVPLITYNKHKMFCAETVNKSYNATENRWKSPEAPLWGSQFLQTKKSASILVNIVTICGRD
jgi:hypothetical protein